jgi:hypothetical protein
MSKEEKPPAVKSPDPPQGYRAAMEREEGTSKGALGQPLITIDPIHLDAQARIPSVMAMATHATVAAWASGAPEWTTLQKEKFDMRTLAGRMGLWESEYKKKSIGLDGEARDEYVDVSKLEAIGPQDDSMIAQNVLNEGSKQMNQKGKK